MSKATACNKKGESNEMNSHLCYSKFSIKHFKKLSSELRKTTHRLDTQTKHIKTIQIKVKDVPFQSDVWPTIFLPVH